MQMESPQDSCRLEPLGPAEFEAYLAHAIPAYAQEKVAAGQWPEAESIELARKEVERVLPRGLATPEHHLFSIRNDVSPAPVGMIWFGAQQRGGRSIAYVFDVWIWEVYRRKGYAMQAFAALEGVVRQLGLCGISLHVFGHNAAARALYARLGYQPTSLVMYKEIA
jgi:RimJ/RimL family protein N-acetyltransferase